MKPLTRLRSATAAISLVAAAISTIPSALAGEIVASQPVGSLPGSFAVGNDGTATYSIPLWVPDGRAGVQPSLSLTYSGSRNSLLGVGWSVTGTGSSITRCGRTYGR